MSKKAFDKMMAGINSAIDYAEGKEEGHRVTRKPGRPVGSTTSDKVALSLRVDRATLERFKAAGPGWQTRMNDVLAKAVGL